MNFDPRISLPPYAANGRELPLDPAIVFGDDDEPRWDEGMFEIARVLEGNELQTSNVTVR